MTIGVDFASSFFLGGGGGGGGFFYPFENFKHFGIRSFAILINKNIVRIYKTKSIDVGQFSLFKCVSTETHFSRLQGG